MWVWSVIVDDHSHKVVWATVFAVWVVGGQIWLVRFRRQRRRAEAASNEEELDELRRRLKKLTS
jgi:cytochrome c-type biogenesis protein CcmH/NrfF